MMSDVAGTPRNNDYSISRLTERELINAMLQDSDDTIVVKSLDGIILSWNAGAQRMYGYTPDEVIGQPISILVPPDQPDEVPGILNRLRRGEKIDHYEAVRIRKDGRRIDVSLSVTPIKDEEGRIVAALKIARDMTAQKRAQRRAEHLQRITSALATVVTLEQVTDVIVHHDFVSLGAHVGAITLFSSDDRTLYLLAQYGDDPVDQGVSAATLCGPASAFSEPGRTGEPLWLEDYHAWTADHPDEPEFWLRDRCRALAILPLMVDDQIMGVMCFGFPEVQVFDNEERNFMQALTQQCAQALTRAQLYEAERLARQQAQKADELKLKFLAMITHELRTPLASIKGFTSTLLSTDVKWDVQSQYGFMQIVDEEADKLTRLIDELLDLSQLQAGRLKIMLELERLAPIVSSARIELEALARDHWLDIHVPADLPLIRVDSRRIAQIMTNLVSNAAKYSPPDTWIRIQAVAEDEFIRVDVSDEGIGIEPEAREEVFEVFQQGNDAFKGVGLGLAICRGLVEAQGGRIWVQDRPESGTTISFTVPIAAT